MTATASWPPPGTRKLARLAHTAVLDASSLYGHARAPWSDAAPSPGVGCAVRRTAHTIALEARCLARPTSGVERYVRALLDHLPSVAPGHRFVAHDAPATARAVARQAGTLSRGEVALHHLTWQDFSGFHNLPLRWARRSVLTVHDLINLRMTAYHPAWERAWYRATLAAATRWADRVIVPSESTRAELCRFVGTASEKVRVIPHGVDPADVASGPLRPDRHGLGSFPYLLCVSKLYAHKGLDTLLDGYARLAARRTSTPALVLVGEPHWAPTVRWIARRMAQPDLAGRTVSLGHVAEEDLAALYAGAGAFVYPSRYEGFGLPILEAMAHGCPVLCSDATSLPEVAGDAALQFCVGDPEALAHALARILDEPRLREQLIERGLARARALSWRACASATARVYEELLEEAA